MSDPYAKPNKAYCKDGSISHIQCRKKTCDWSTASTDIDSDENCVINTIHERKTGLGSNEWNSVAVPCPSNYTVEDMNCTTTNGGKMNFNGNSITGTEISNSTFMPTESWCSYKRNYASVSQITATTTASVLCRKTACEDYGSRSLCGST